MSVFRHSSMALRRMASKNKSNKRPYTQLTQPAMKVSQTHSNAQTKSGSDGWIVPAAIAILGLGFSTFSTHQLMTASSNEYALPNKK